MHYGAVMPTVVQPLASDTTQIARAFGWPEYMPTRLARVYCDCSRTMLQREGPAPVGKRGRTYIYSKSSLDQWLTSGLDKSGNAETRPAPRRAPTSGDALERLRALRKGGTP